MQCFTYTQIVEIIKLVSYLVCWHCITRKESSFCLHMQKHEMKDMAARFDW